MERNLIGPLYKMAKNNLMLFYIKNMHFNDIYDHSHICEKNNMTVT